jgi:hypothetical protein
MLFSVADMARAFFVALFALSHFAFAQGITALSALKLLPKDAAKRLARIEAREGAPWPERWYFLVHDPAQPLGLREFAVADAEVKASRTLSQFADELKPSDVIGADGVKIDSDTVASLAGRFSVANGARFGSLNYELGKYGAAGATAWRATVLNDKGDPLGVLIVDAGTGRVERHDGFDNNPIDASPEPAETPIPVARVIPKARPAATPAKPATAAALLQKPVLDTKPTPRPGQTAKVATPVKPKPPVAAATPTPAPNAIKRLGTSVKKLFGN